MAGFDLHPSLVATGVVRHDLLPPVVETVHEASGAADVARLAALDRELRGGAHGVDLAFLLHEGSCLLIDDRGGYALTGRRPLLVAAFRDDVAADLLVAALHRLPEGETPNFGWLTAAQQWALQVALQAGLELHPSGPVCTRGMQPPAPYIPTGAFL
jgi:hypothetical protein